MDEEVTAVSCKGCTRLQSRLERALRQLERQLKFGEELRGENEELKRQLHKLRQKQRHKAGTELVRADVASQTEEVPTEGSSSGDCGSLGATVEATVGDPELEAAAAGGCGTELSVADLLRDTANACLNQNGYVYDDKSGLYYDYSSGYYYDPHSKLFYEPRSRTYYAYDEEKREYRLHSQESADHLRRHCEKVFIQSGSQHAPPKKRAKKSRSENGLNHKAKNESVHRSDRQEESSSEPPAPFIGPIFNGAPKKTENDKEEETKESDAEEDEEEEEEEDGEVEDVEEGEITSESEVAQNSPGGFYEEDEKLLEEPEDEEEEETYAPCVRLMVLSSPSLTTGSLFIVTCIGGTIGKTSSRYSHAVTIDDPSARERHCIISYNSDSASYSIRDTKRHGNTCVNGERAAKNDSLALRHGDRLCVADTEMLVHIHEGNETCDDCEPGVVMANAKLIDDCSDQGPSLSREEQRREEAKRLRSKFGLRGAAFEPVRARGRDRAAERRRKVGSDVPASAHRVEVASAHRHIPDSNKGAQMLAKMGWKPGQSLGRSGTAGIVEPVTAELRMDPQAGLGSALPSLSLDAASAPSVLSRARHLQKMRERFSRIQGNGGDREEC